MSPAGLAVDRARSAHIPAVVLDLIGAGIKTEPRNRKREARRSPRTREIDGGRQVDRRDALLIAKLDRLSRDAHFLLGLQKAGVRFVAADMPEANELMVGVMAIVAQAERKMISARTSAALAEARKRIAVTGQRKHPEIKRLGCPTGAAHLRRFGNGAAVKAIGDQAKERAAGLAATFDAIKAEGITSANRIARALNARHIATPRGGQWTARSVLNITARLT
jgi:DNA invertase Pin-like site-specific DNA recombinase